MSTPAASIEEVDVNDPCALAAVLRRAYAQAVSGERETKVRFRDGESEQEVTYGPANVPALKTLLAQQEDACARQKGQHRRFCVRAG